MQVEICALLQGDKNLYPSFGKARIGGAWLWVFVDVV
jgi:hypothetical protein